MKDPFQPQCWYDPKKHGSLDDYLKIQLDSTGTFCLFKGVKQFNLLWDAGYIISNFTCIRLMYNLGRGDEHYCVIDKNTVSGVNAGFHAGKPGTHEIKDILAKDAPAFEAHPLKRKDGGIS